MIECDAAAARLRQLERLRCSLDRRLGLGELDEPLHGAGRALHLVPHLGQRSGRDAHVAGIHQELAELPERQGAGEHLARADPQHERDGAEYERRPERREPALQPIAPDGHRERMLDSLAKTLRLQRLEIERLHGLNRIDGFAGKRARIGHAILRVAR